MGYIRTLKYDEQKELVSKIKPGKFILIYENPDHWGMYLADSAPKDKTAYTIVIIDSDYDAPGDHERVDISYSHDRASGMVVDTHGVIAVYDTKEEADAVAEQMHALITNFKEEIKGALLKCEMGITVILAQSED